MQKVKKRYTHNKSLKALLSCARSERVSKPNHSKKKKKNTIILVWAKPTTAVRDKLLLGSLEKNKSGFCSHEADNGPNGQRIIIIKIPVIDPFDKDLDNFKYYVDHL